MFHHRDLREPAYTGLKRIAALRLRKEQRCLTLTPTALANEAWLRLVRQNREYQDTQHFLAVAAMAMRRILVDRARARQAVCRGQGQPAAGLGDFPSLRSKMPDHSLLELEDALQRLETISSRAAHVVNMRFFGGLTEAETAHALGVNRRTVNRDWEMARAWLRGELNPAPVSPGQI